MTPQRGHKCRHAFCPNRYSDVIGGDSAFGKHKAGGVCIPCFFAEQLVEQGITPEKVESLPSLMKQFAPFLSATGWTWAHVLESYRRAKQATEPAQ